MNLKDLLKNIDPISVDGETDLDISGLALDSRRVKDGYLFFAVSGTKLDGHDFIHGAITAGARVVVCEKLPANTHVGITYILVKNTNDVVGIIASHFFGNPSMKLKIVGVTGTNGKTTIATMLYKLFTDLGKRSGLLSTIENKIGDTTIPATHTTGDAIQIEENLAKMVEAGCEYAFMEVSSHSVVQKRISGINFAGGIFTNLTQDHLDYHKDIEEYSRAKKMFFDGLSHEAFALYNEDDEYGDFMVSDSLAKKYSYGEFSSDFPFVIERKDSEGLTLMIKNTEVKSSLVGKFNAYNLTSIFAAAVLLGIKDAEAAAALKNISGARGRMEKIIGKNGVIGIVDYSHTPDALKNALETINDFKGNARVITVFGAGGDRDKTKRPLMGKIASELSDLSIITTDNPRSENPEEIIKEILAGVFNKERVVVIVDRMEAIKEAFHKSISGDIILLAGKGHEDYQEVNGVKTHFSDKEALEKVLC